MCVRQATWRERVFLRHMTEKFDVLCYYYGIEAALQRFLDLRRLIPELLVASRTISVLLFADPSRALYFSSSSDAVRLRLVRHFKPRAVLFRNLPPPLVPPEIYNSRRTRSDAALRGAPVRRRIRVCMGLLCGPHARQPQLVSGDGRLQRIRWRARVSRVAREDCAHTGAPERTRIEPLERSVRQRSSAVLLCKRIRLELWTETRASRRRNRYGAMRCVLFDWFATD